MQRVQSTFSKSNAIFSEVSRDFMYTGHTTFLSPNDVCNGFDGFAAAVNAEKVRNLSSSEELLEIFNID